MMNQRNCLNSQSTNERFDDANMCAPPRLLISTDQNNSTCSAANQICAKRRFPFYSVGAEPTESGQHANRAQHSQCMLNRVPGTASHVFGCIKTVCGREKQTQLLNVWRKKHSANNERRLLRSLLSIFILRWNFIAC